MAPSNSKANYKTYEAQARMVRAIVAAHPDVKWNYREIAACYGSDMTEHALNHRFRRLRAQCTIIREARQQGRDMKDMGNPDDLPTKQEAVDKTNIAKYFGQSTPDGMQFQFRGIKRDAELLRKVEAEGGDVANCLNGTGGALGSAASTPAAKATPSRARASTGRKRVAALKRSSSDDEDDDDEDDVDDGKWSVRDDDDDDDTPSKRPRAGPAAGQKSVTPRRAAQKASATIAVAAAALQDSASPSPVNTPPAARRRTPLPTRRAASLFGPFDEQTRPVAARNGRAGSSYVATTAMDSPRGSPDDADMRDDNYASGYGDGEI